MVVSKDSKKKRKDSPIVDTPPELPKRTKVQAQRKFAQGQSAPATAFTTAGTSSSAATGTSQPGTPARDNREPPPELITHKRPRTEDFLTFLCFRGTSVLPSHLDFLNQNKNSTNKDESKTPGDTDNKKEDSKESASTSKDIMNTETNKKDQKKEMIPFAVRKRAEQVTEGNRKVKASDRMTRLRDRSVKKEESNRRSPRTKNGNESIEENAETTVEQDEPEKDSEGKKSNQVTAKNKKKVNQKRKSKETKNAPEPPSEENDQKINTSQNIAQGGTAEVKDTSQDEVDNKRKKMKVKRTSTPVEPSGRMTRQRAFFEPVKVPKKTQEDKNENSKEEEDLEQEKVITKNEFSSDDEQPLAKTMKLKKKSPKKSPKGKASVEAKGNKKQKNSSSVSEIEKESTPSLRRTLPRSKSGAKESTVRAGSVSKKSDTSSKPSAVVSKKRTRSDKGKSDLPSDDDTFGQLSPKRRSKRNDTDAAASLHSQTDISENETKTGRPTRKTKEAATIYMELIGQKLNLDGFDDDDEDSVDSFPELPNAKKTQKLENDLKKNVENQKPKPKNNRKTTKVPKKQPTKKLSSKKNLNLCNDESKDEVECIDPKEKDGKCSKSAVTDDEKDMNSKLEKSFSDSDDEPLATKVQKPLEKDPLDPKKSESLTATDLTQKKSSQEKTVDLPQLTPILSTSPLNKPTGSKTKVNLADSNSKPASSTCFPPLADRFPSPKVNPTFLTPKFDRNMERRLPVDATQTSSPTSKVGLIPSPSGVRNDTSTTKSTSPNNSLNNSKKLETESLFSANLMPSKEESGKIFGIASVTLAQSSGPDNTKCTLGKCGSVHKPVLGPVVPTEAYLGEQLSSKERRKAKVNMTHEQIQKWLIECSSNPDDIRDDLDDDFETPLKPMVFAPTPPLIREDKGSPSLSSSSKTAKDTTKNESVWSGKGPCLKATPVMVREEQKTPTLVPEASKPEENTDAIYETSAKSLKQTDIVKKDKDQTEVKKKASPSIKARDNMKSPKPSTSSTTTSSPQHQRAAQLMKEETKKDAVKKIQKRQPVYSAKIAEPVMKKPVANNFTAFSPENETSVYSFDKEDDAPPPMAKPFRRHSRRESHNDDSQSENKNDKLIGKVDTSGKDKVSSKEVPQSSISVTLSPEDNSKLVSLDGEAAFKTASSEKGQGNEITGLADFYIPLQGIGASGATGGKNSDVIQGVAVKLGREGPDGPNQRVIMHATLVTKSQMGSNPTPLPDSINVQEIVKSYLSSTKDSNGSPNSKSVPVGTVQPRFKSTRDQQDPSGSGLTRVNSNSSLFSGSNKSRSASGGQKKNKDDTPIKMCNNTAFPRRDDPAQMVEAPIFRPTEKEFQDPMEFIERITPIAARFGLCKIIPPASFKPECRISDDMRFTAYNQYVHKMLHRWGPSAKELSAIKKYLATQSIAMAHPPWIGGMEVDLPRLYHTVQELGGLKEVIEKKKWARVAEEMCIPKLAQDRVTKLDDIYCKYLLPYDTLSPAERQKLFDEVEADWAKREARARRNADRCVNLESVSNDGDGSSDEDEESEEEVDGVSMECIVKGRNMPLSQFFRIARNTMALWFKNAEPTVADIEAEFWRHVAVKDSHVCVHSGSIDSSGWGYGFPTPGPKAKGSQCAKHPWNLKVLTNNSGSVLRSLGPVMGVTVPTLHVGMLFSACCWYRDPHGLSWIEYLHTGASKIWYGIPDEQSTSFRAALTALIPTHCQNKTIWLPCDTVMVPPHMLTDRNVSLCRTEQKPGEFVVVFPRAYTSSVATGYVVSESVYFATSSWLDSAKEDFRDIHDSCEPAMFSLEQLLFAIASDQRVSLDILSQILSMLIEVYEKEVAAREQLKAAGVTSTEKLQSSGGKLKQKHVAEVYECDLCRANLYISMVKTDDGNLYCLQHALKNINNGNVLAKQCTLVFKYNVEEVEETSKKLQERLEQKKPSTVATSKKANTSK